MNAPSPKRLPDPEHPEELLYMQRALARRGITLRLGDPRATRPPRTRLEIEGELLSEVVIRLRRGG